LASNVFAHSDKLKEMAECMFKLLNKNGTLIIEVQYLLNTLKDLTFDNIYHEHYNYWSLTSLNNFFNPSLDASQIPFSVINPVTYLAGVTSKAKFTTLLFLG